MNVSLVPVEQILASDGRDGGIFRLAGVRIIFPIRQLDSFAVGDSVNLVVAPRDAVIRLLLRQVELVGTEFWMLEQIGENFEYVVEITFQTTQADDGRIGAAGSFYFGGAHFQEIVHLIAGLRPGSTRAPDFAEEFHQSNFAGGLIARSAANARRSRDQR